MHGKGLPSHTAVLRTTITSACYLSILSRARARRRSRSLWGKRHQAFPRCSLVPLQKNPRKFVRCVRHLATNLMWRGEKGNCSSLLRKKTLRKYRQSSGSRIPLEPRLGRTLGVSMFNYRFLRPAAPALMSQHRSRRLPKRSRQARRLVVECLEDRRLLAGDPGFVPEKYGGDDPTNPALTTNTFLSVYGETRLLTPTAGTPYQDWTIVNYVDQDSGANSIQDYQGGSYTYDGHDALDLTTSSFDAMDIGIPIYAAATGVVHDLDDGHADRNTCGGSCTTPPNYVILDHGNGWRTSYYHLRKDSVVVKMGQLVQAGDIIGLMGSSGRSTDAHLHFAVTHNGQTVETYNDPSAYWYNPLPYAGTQPGALDFGTTDHVPTTAELKERPPERETFPANAFQPVVFWANLHGIQSGDKLSFVWKSPQGKVFQQNTYTSGELRYGWKMDAFTLPFDMFSPTSTIAGQWTVELLHNGTMIAQDTFMVSGTNSSTDSHFEFKTGNHYTTENGGSVQLTVKREGPRGTASVNYSLIDWTAKPGMDYSPVSGTLTFLPGQMEQTIIVPIVDNILFEQQEKFLVMLSSPSSGSYLGIQWLTSVNIIDNDTLKFQKVARVQARPAICGSR